MAVVWRLGAGYTSGVDYVTNSAASGTSLAINKPSGLVDGQTLRAYFYSQASAGAATTTPSGWTLEVAPSARRGGIYRKYIPSAAAETATDYTFSQGGSGRMVGVIWLSDGEPSSSPTDAVGTFVTETTAPTAASLTAVESDDLLATFHYWNNSTNTVTASNFPGSMTELIEVSSPTTGNTSGIGIAVEQLSASGATGTRQVTGTPTPVNASAVSILYKAVPAPPSRTATLGVTLGGTAVASEGGAIRTATLGVTLGGSAPAAKLAQYIPQSFSVPEMDAWIAKGWPVHWAHRGGSANWSEMTMFAYDNAVERGARCLEVSVHRSSDGVWIMSHDATLTRVTAETYTISSTSSSTLLGIPVDTPGSGGVIGRLEDVLDAYGDSKVILVDNKPGSFFSDFLDLLETYPNAHDQFIVKLDGQFGSLTNFQAAKARGFKTAGYWYPNNYAAHLPGKAADTDYIGMQYDATSGEWADIFAYGKPVWGHVIQNSTQYNLCTTAGVDIYQLADFDGLAPGWNTAYSTDGVTTGGTASALSGFTVTATLGVTLGGSATIVEREVATATAGVALGGSTAISERHTTIAGGPRDDFDSTSPFTALDTGLDTVISGALRHSPTTKAHRYRYDANRQFPYDTVYSTRVKLTDGTSPNLGGLAFVNPAAPTQVIIIMVDIRNGTGSSAGLQIRESTATTNLTSVVPSEAIAYNVWYRIDASLTAGGRVIANVWNDDTGTLIASGQHTLSLYTPFSTSHPAVYSYDDTDHDWFAINGGGGNVTIGGSAVSVEREVATATLGVTLGGSGAAVQSYTRTATLPVTLGGSGASSEREFVTATLGVTLGGTADGQAAGGAVTRTATLGVTLGGSAISVGQLSSAATLGVTLGGTAAASAFGGSVTRTATLSTTIGGTASVIEREIAVATLGVTLSGSATSIERQLATAIGGVALGGWNLVSEREFVTATLPVVLSGFGGYLPPEGFPDIPKNRSIRNATVYRTIRLVTRR